MTRNYRHILSGLLAGLCCVWLVSCEKQAVYRITPSDNVYLSFSPVLVDEADGGGTAGAGLRQVTPATEAQAEGLRSLRVVVVSADEDEDGNKTGTYTVESNEIFTSATTLQSGKLTIPIREAREKTLYLIGNVDDAHTITDKSGQEINLARSEWYIPGADGVAPIEESRFIWTPAEKPDWIPATAKYHIEVPEKESLTLHDGIYYYGLSEPLYLVRAVTKFSFEYVNETRAGGAPTYYRLKAWGLSQVADGPSYLLAHVADDWATSTRPSSDKLTEYAALPYTPHWPRWLADEAEKTAKPETTPADYEWMTAYSLPQESHKDGLFPMYDGSDESNGLPYNIAPASEQNPASPTPLKVSYYLPESRYVDGSSTQAYQIEFHFWEWQDQFANRREVTYKKPLPNCQSLFRNTEVRLKVRITAEGGVSLQATVCPWTEPAPIDIPPFE